MIKCFSILLKRPAEKFKEPYDPDWREVAVVKLKTGKTKRQYRQVAATPNTKADNEWWSEYLAHPYRASYEKYVQGNEVLVKKFKRMKEESNVREPKQAPGGPVAEIVVLESRRGSKPRLHVSERHMSSCASERSASAGIAG